MITLINEHKLNDKTKEIFNIFTAYNLTASLMEAKPVELRLMEMVDSQAILGETFRVNVHNDNKVSIMILKTDTYDEVMALEAKVKDLVDPFYELEIDGRSNPVIAKFRIDLPTLADGKAFVGAMMDLIEIK